MQRCIWWLYTISSASKPVATHDSSSHTGMFQSIQLRVIIGCSTGRISKVGRLATSTLGLFSNRRILSIGRHWFAAEDVEHDWGRKWYSDQTNLSVGAPWKIDFVSPHSPDHVTPPLTRIWKSKRDMIHVSVKVTKALSLHIYNW